MFLFFVFHVLSLTHAESLVVRLDEGKFVGSTQKLGKSTVKRKAIPAPAAKQVLKLSPLEVLRKVCALTGTQSNPDAQAKSMGCPQIVVSELRCFLKEMRDDVLIVTASQGSGDPSHHAGAVMHEAEVQ